MYKQYLNQPIRILLIEDDQEDAFIVRSRLKELDSLKTKVTHVSDMSQSLLALRKDQFDLILLDLKIPGSEPLDTFNQIIKKTDTPIVILTGLKDNDFGAKLVTMGAQDYLVKEEVTPVLLGRTMIHTLERSEILNELNQKNRDLESFTSMVSHDLRNPIGASFSSMEILRRSIEQKDWNTSSEVLELIESSLGHAIELIERLLLFSQTGGSLKKSKIPLCSCLGQAKGNLSQQINSTQTDIKFTDLPTLLVDEVLITQVFQNIIGNAIKYCNDQPAIFISSWEHNGEHVIQIQDNGIGISKDDMKKVFDMSSRVGNTSSRKGLGIGLATVKKIIEAHGGRIWVESELEIGSSFYFSLPTD